MTSEEKGPAEEALLSSEQVAEVLNISSRCVLNWLYAGIIPVAVRVGKVIRFRMVDVQAALEKATQQTAPATDSEDIARYVVWLLAPDVADMPTWMIDREPTPEEEKRAAGRAAVHWPNLRGLETPEERREYCESVIAAAHMADQEPRTKPE